MASLLSSQAAVSATMLVWGTINSNDTISPTVGDKVTAINWATKTVEAIGKVESSNGLFTVQIDKPIEANNRLAIALRLHKGNSTYVLMEEADQDYYLYFYGGNGIFPYMESFTLNIGDRTSYVPDDGGTGDTDNNTDSGSSGSNSDSEDNAPPPPPDGDLNGDGIIDVVDISIAKAALGSKDADSRIDLNRDGRITAQDIILIIKAARKSALSRMSTKPLDSKTSDSATDINKDGSTSALDNISTIKATKRSELIDRRNNARTSIQRRR